MSGSIGSWRVCLERRARYRSESIVGNVREPFALAAFTALPGANLAAFFAVSGVPAQGRTPARRPVAASDGQPVGGNVRRGASLSVSRESGKSGHPEGVQRAETPPLNVFAQRLPNTCLCPECHTLKMPGLGASLVLRENPARVSLPAPLLTAPDQGASPVSRAPCPSVAAAVDAVVPGISAPRAVRRSAGWVATGRDWRENGGACGGVASAVSTNRSIRQARAAPAVAGPRPAGRRRIRRRSVA